MPPPFVYRTQGVGHSDVFPTHAPWSNRQNISRANYVGSVINVAPPAIEWAADLPFSVPDTVFYPGHRFLSASYGQSTVLDANVTADADGVSDYNWEYQFTSREYDSETALQYFRARFYHDGIGRFVGRDPLEFIDGGNLYAGYFVPWAVDPTGRWAVAWPLIFVPLAPWVVPVIIGVAVILVLTPVIVDVVPKIVDKVTDPFTDPWWHPKPKQDPKPYPIDVFPPIDCDDDPPETCATKHSDIATCSQYDYGSYGQALRSCFPGRGITPRRRPATECEGGGGYHWDIYKKKQGKIGSIICCPCCDDSSGKPVLKTRCNCN